eukprot:CAMPEP_0206386990 /NCGR_PEP_ID=MMETSP0294-20121207/16307_1 /ASSEMBLY_ACC=CAM_ASM_000327 /TAXON_ID=39354 /ORGANISM="Heterosigma akashiwo, Strain CCMP2393" /LENGTH=366 /DNA_ID=CAMNT_0053838213 /DNA_START=62 /DNA_END=1162 /DNA_ORIENTATION=-
MRPSHISKRVSQMQGTSGISKSQLLLLQKSKRVGGKEKKQPRISRDKLNDLARPKPGHEGTLYKTVETDRALRRAFRGVSREERIRMSHATADDLKNATFRPKIKNNPFGEVMAGGDDDAPKDENAVIYRLEAYKRGVQKKITEAIGKNEYDVKLDKKQCPQCGAVQSYDEVIEKRKKCPNCGVVYKKKTTWGRVEQDFMERMHESQEKIAKKVTALRKEQLKGIGHPEMKRRSGDDDKIATLTDEEFLVRMQDDLYRRELRQAQHEFELDTAMPKECTFEPQLSKDFRLPVDQSSFHERMAYDIHRRQGYQALFDHGAPELSSPNHRAALRSSRHLRAAQKAIQGDEPPEVTLLRDSRVSLDPRK